MSKEDKKSLFKKFGVLESSRDMNSNGLGLGLYISKSILNKLGGEITWKSTKGVGTTFTINFLVDAMKDVSYQKISSKYNFPVQKNKINKTPIKIRSSSSIHSHSNYSDLQILEENIDVKLPYDFMKTNDRRNQNSLNMVTFIV